MRIFERPKIMLHTSGQRRFVYRSAFGSSLIGWLAVAHAHTRTLTHTGTRTHRYTHTNTPTHAVARQCCSYKASRLSFGGTTRTPACSQTATAANQRNHPARTRTRTRTKDKDICFGQQPTSQVQVSAPPLLARKCAPRLQNPNSKQWLKRTKIQLKFWSDAIGSVFK